MLTLSIQNNSELEYWDEQTQEFYYPPETDVDVLLLEHSLVSISEWEAKYKKAFLSQTEKKTKEESLDYVRMMTLNRDRIPDELYNWLTPEQMEQIQRYIEDPRTATKIYSNDPDNGRSNNNQRLTTSEDIYCAMIAHNIPVEFQYWHLNRLLTLIRVCIIRNNPDSKANKMTKKETMSMYARLNAERRQKLNSKG